MAEASFVRFALLRDGCAQATFSDCSAVVLNAHGAAFAVFSPDGIPTRQLTACATSAHRAKVWLALHLRNLLGHAAPHVVWPCMMPASTFYFERQHPLRAVYWPRTLSGALALRHADGAIRIMSADRLAWLLLHPEGHTYAVCYPVIAQSTDEPLPPAIAGAGLPSPSPTALRHVFCAQLHATADPHPSWDHALELARAAAREPSGCITSSRAGWVPTAELLQLAASPPAVGGPRISRSTAAPLPAEASRLLMRHTAPKEAAAVADENACGNAPPPCASAADTLATSLPEDGDTTAHEWWRLPISDGAAVSLSNDPLSTWLPAHAIRLLLTPHALLRIPNRADAAAPAVAAELLGDGTTVNLDALGHFWEHTTTTTEGDETDGRRMYAAGRVPPTLRCDAARGASGEIGPAPLAAITTLGEVAWNHDKQMRAKADANAAPPLRTPSGDASMIVEEAVRPMRR